MCQHAFEVMQGNAFQEISSKLRQPCDIGQAGYEVAAPFLLSTGQGHNVDTVSAQDCCLTSLDCLCSSLDQPSSVLDLLDLPV